MEIKKWLGIFLITIGLFLIDKNVTGGVVGTKQSIYYSLLGALLFFMGLILSIDDKIRKRFRSRSGLREHNQEAAHFMRQIYKEEYGETPTPNQLKKYMRQHHGIPMSEMIEDYKADQGYDTGA